MRLATRHALHPRGDRPKTRFVLRCLLWLLTLILFIVALKLKDPHLNPVRAYATWALVGLVGCALYCFIRFTRRLQRFTGCLLLLAALLVGLYAEFSFRFHRYVILNRPADGISQHLGEHFIVGFDDWSTVQTLAERGLIGGIYLSRRNLAGETHDSLRQRLCKLQTQRKRAGLPELFVAADQEGGIVSHLSPILPRRPALSALLTPGEDPATLDARAHAAGIMQGQDLARLGVNLNLSPVADLKAGHQGRNRLDFNTLIGQRAIASDPGLVTRVTRAYVKGLNAQGIHATLKHFPGLGSVGRDTHHFSADLLTPVETLQARDWLPFREVAAQTGALIMLGHVRVPELDRRHPASFSKTIVQGLIRDTWQHQGALITDDLSMGAAYNHGLCHVTSQALNAGVDLMLLSYDHEKIYDVLYCAARSYSRGELDMAQLARSRTRLAALRSDATTAAITNITNHCQHAAPQ